MIYAQSWALTIFNEDEERKIEHFPVPVPEQEYKGSCLNHVPRKKRHSKSLICFREETR